MDEFTLTQQIPSMCGTKLKISIPKVNIETKTTYVPHSYIWDSKCIYVVHSVGFSFSVSSLGIHT